MNVDAMVTGSTPTGRGQSFEITRWVEQVLVRTMAARTRSLELGCTYRICRMAGRVLFVSPRPKVSVELLYVHFIGEKDDFSGHPEGQDRATRSVVYQSEESALV